MDEAEHFEFLLGWLDRAEDMVSPHRFDLGQGRGIDTDGDPYGMRLVSMVRAVLAGHGPVQAAWAAGTATRCKCCPPTRAWPCDTVRAVLSIDLADASAGSGDV